MLAAFLIRPVYAKSGKGGSVNFEEKVVIMGKGNGCLVIAGRDFFFAKDLVIKNKGGKEIPLTKIKTPIKAFVRYSIRVEDNVPFLHSIDLLE
jgi:hypothetical protein